MTTTIGQSRRQAEAVAPELQTAIEYQCWPGCGRRIWLPSYAMTLTCSRCHAALRPTGRYNAPSLATSLPDRSRPKPKPKPTSEEINQDDEAAP